MKQIPSYIKFVNDLKQTIIRSRYYAARLANQEQLLLYFKAGKALSDMILKEQWGSSVLESISADLQKQMPGLKGFSARNLRKMRQFFEAYEKFSLWPSMTAKFPRDENQNYTFCSPATAKIDEFIGISFSHHILILNKCLEDEERFFYISKASSEFWSVSVLEHNIDGQLFKRQGNLPNNFSKALPEKLKPAAIELFNDEYLMDYMNLGVDDDEREIENKIVANIRDFILRMGKGFSFIGNQFRVELAGDEFFIDLLFFNRHLQCLVAFELKRGKFTPAYAGQLNFYLNVLDQKIKLPHENDSIGIVLCKEKNNTVVEYSVKTMNKAMGVATYKTTQNIPGEMIKILPNPAELLMLL